MPITTFENLYDPEILLRAFNEAYMSKSALIKSGMCAPDLEIGKRVREGIGSKITIPTFSVGSAESSIPTQTAVNITSDSMSVKTQLALLQHRTKAWGQYDLAKIMSGMDSMATAGSILAEFWAKQEQLLLIASLTGMFADNTANDSSDLINSIFSETGASPTAEKVISVAALIATAAKMGDSIDSFVGVAMHPEVYANYATLQAGLSANTATEIKGLVIDKALGLYILIDDTLPKRAGTTDGFVYDTYMFKAGAGILNTNFSTVLDRDEKTGTGSGAETLITRWNGVVHPNGFSADGSIAGLSATTTELETPETWNRILDKKNTGFVLLRSNG